MNKITVTYLRKNIFDILTSVSKGNSILIERNGKEVAVIVPAKINNWRDKIKSKPKLLVSEEEAFIPVEDVWKDYL